MIPDLVPISEIRGYIAQLTGVLVSRRAVKRWTNNNEIPILVLPSDRRRKYTTKRYVYQFIKKHVKPEPEPTFEEARKAIFS